MYEYDFIDFIVPVLYLDADVIRDYEDADYDRLIRCKDCKHRKEACVKTGNDSYCEIMLCFHNDNWFCADGVKKEE